MCRRSPTAPPSPVTGAFALHITSTIPTGMVATTGGACMASADQFHIRVHGAGGHASEPFRTIDPIPIACEIVQALQLMVTRRIDVFDPAVVTVGRIQAGTTNNIIPPVAEIEGTIRTVSERDPLQGPRPSPACRRPTSPRRTVPPPSPRSCSAIRSPRTTTSSPTSRSTPPARCSATGTCTGSRTRSWAPRTSRTCSTRSPGTMMFLGGTHPDRDVRSAPANHSNLVVFDEDAMPYGVELYAQMALRHLA